MKQYLNIVGYVAGLTLPLFNLPLMRRLLRRRSSADVSLTWALGVFGCLLFMTPSALFSPDPLFRIFTLANLLLFSGVTFLVVYYRFKK